MLDLDRRQKEGLLRELDVLALEPKLDGLPQVRQGLLDGAALARDVEFRAPEDEPCALPVDGRGELQLHRERMNPAPIYGCWTESAAIPRGTEPTGDAEIPRPNPFRVHIDPGKGLIRAINARTKIVVGHDYAVQDGDVIKIVART